MDYRSQASSSRRVTGARNGYPDRGLDRRPGVADVVREHRFLVEANNAQRPFVLVIHHVEGSNAIPSIGIQPPHEQNVYGYLRDNTDLMVAINAAIANRTEDGRWNYVRNERNNNRAVGRIRAVSSDENWRHLTRVGSQESMDTNRSGATGFTRNRSPTPQRDYDSSSESGASARVCACRCQRLRMVTAAQGPDDTSQYGDGDGYPQTLQI